MPPISAVFFSFLQKMIANDHLRSRKRDSARSTDAQCGLRALTDGRTVLGPEGPEVEGGGHRPDRDNAAVCGGAGLCSRGGVSPPDVVL